MLKEMESTVKITIKISQQQSQLEAAIMKQILSQIQQRKHGIKQCLMIHLQGLILRDQ
jgi:uncharacterized protein YwbE